MILLLSWQLTKLVHRNCSISDNNLQIKIQEVKFIAKPLTNTKVKYKRLIAKPLNSDNTDILVCSLHISMKL